MQTIYLDISNKGVIPTIYAKQGDVGRKFKVVLTDSGLPYIPVGGSAFSVWYSGASGEGNYTDIGGKSAFSVNENKVTVEMIAQMLSNNGDGVLSLVLNNPNGNQIASWNIPYICEFIPGAGSEEAKAYYTAFSNAVANLPYPDASLSVSGKAADAKATGNALAKKAPSGYAEGGHDTVVAQGTSGIWQYRKWASGKAECWALRAFNDVCANTVSGSLYWSDSLANAPYPFTFADVPVEIATLRSAYGGWLNASTVNSTSYTGTYRVVRTLNQTNTYACHVSTYVIGRWK